MVHCSVSLRGGNYSVPSLFRSCHPSLQLGHRLRETIDLCLLRLWLELRLLIVAVRERLLSYRREGIGLRFR